MIESIDPTRLQNETQKATINHSNHYSPDLTVHERTEGNTIQDHAATHNDVTRPSDLTIHENPVTQGSFKIPDKNALNQQLREVHESSAALNNEASVENVTNSNAIIDHRYSKHSN